MVEIISVKIAGGDITPEKAAEIFKTNLNSENCRSRDFQAAVMEDVMSLAQVSTIWGGQRAFTYQTEAQFREVLLGKIVLITPRIPIVERRLKLAETRKIVGTHKHPNETIAKMGSIPANLHQAIQAIVGAPPGNNGNGSLYGETGHNTDPVTKKPKAGQIVVKEYYLTTGPGRASQPYRFTSRSERGMSTFYYSSSHIGNSYQYKLLCNDEGVPIVRDTSNQWGDSILREPI